MKITKLVPALALLGMAASFAMADAAPAPKADENPHLVPKTRAEALERRAREELENAKEAMKKFAKAPNPSAGLRYLMHAERALRIAREKSRGLELDLAHEIDRKATPALVANLVRQAEIQLERGAERAARAAIDKALAIDATDAAAKRVLEAVIRAESDDEPEVVSGNATRRQAETRRRALRGDVPPNFRERWNSRRPNPFR